MPGGRLGHDDRRQIAAGLADGLGYAEIARRLGRPTSTVSREVGRNGGPGGYRADQAQHATGRRARRRGPAIPAQPATAEAGTGRDPVAVREFVARFAVLMGQTGVPRMPARVLTALFTTDSGALTAAELVGRLGVSPASVSKAIGYLEALGLVRRERDAWPRRERYVVDDDVWLRAWMVSADAQSRWADAAREGVAIFGATTPAGVRLAGMGRFFTQLGDDMAGGPSAAAFGDLLTVLAALLHAGRPCAADELAAALDWSPDRVTAALRDAERHPDVTDPVVLQRIPDGGYTVAARTERLTPAQRAALRSGT